MKKSIIFCIFIFVVISNITFSEEEQMSSSFSISISQDPAFGFYPSVAGSFEISKFINFTFYGTFWTQDILGGKQGGTNLFTEFGVGLGFSLFQGSLYINPSIGVCGGNFQSGGGDPVIADAISPNLNINYSNDKFSCSMALIIWKHLREKSNNKPFIDQFEYIISPSYYLTKNFSLGLYYDHYFYNSIIKNNIRTTNGFMWIGPLVRFTLKNGMSLSLASGFDLVDYLENVDGPQLKEFYKMVAVLPF